MKCLFRIAKNRKQVRCPSIGRWFNICCYTSTVAVVHLYVVSFVTPWTVARQAPLSLEFTRQEYWSGFPFPSPGDHPDIGIKPSSPALQVDYSPLCPQGSPYPYYSAITQNELLVDAQQFRWTFREFCGAEKELNHKMLHFVQFHLYNTSEVTKFWKSTRDWLSGLSDAHKRITLGILVTELFLSWFLW